MRRALALLCGLMLLAATPARASTIVYSAPLSGAIESPPNVSPGTGLAMLTYDTLLHSLTVDVTFSGLLGTTTASHVHCCTAAPESGTAGVATELPSFTGFPLGVTSGTYHHVFDMTDASMWNPAFLAGVGGVVSAAEATFIGGLDSGTAYLNVHSTFAPGGEIRGFPAAAVPEPGILTLLGLGLAGAIRRGRSHR